MNKDTKDTTKHKYQFKTSKVIDNKKMNSYFYKNGYRVNAKSDTDKFFEDVMNYAKVKPEDIKTEEDLENVFQKLNNKGYKFHFTDTSKDAVKDTFISKGNKFTEETKKEQEKVEVKHIKRELSSKKKRKIEHKLIKKREGHHIVTYEQITIMFKQFEDGRGRKQ